MIDIKHKRFVFLVTMTLGFCLAPIIFAESLQPSEIVPEQVSAMVAKSSKLMIIDVRSSTEYAQEHVAGALNIPFNQIATSAPSLDVPKIIYCLNDKCPLSLLAAKTMLEAGHKDVKLLSGGMEGWKIKGLPTEGNAISKSTVKLAMNLVTPEKALNFLASPKYKFVDLREFSAFNAGHIKGALHVALEDLKSKSQNFDRKTILVVYDSNAERARSGLQILLTDGYAAAELSGGASAWAIRKYPMEAGAD